MINRIQLPPYQAIVNDYLTRTDKPLPQEAKILDIAKKILIEADPSFRKNISDAQGHWKISLFRFILIHFPKFYVRFFPSGKKIVQKIEDELAKRTKKKEPIVTPKPKDPKDNVLSPSIFHRLISSELSPKKNLALCDQTTKRIHKIILDSFKIESNKTAVEPHLKIKKVDKYTYSICPGEFKIDSRKLEELPLTEIKRSLLTQLKLSKIVKDLKE